MLTVTVPQRQIPVLLQTDLLVVGAGPAGIATAICAARHGVKVTMIERWPSVGGQATNCSVNIWHLSDRTRQVICGIAGELVERAGEGIRPLPGFPSRWETHEFDPHLMRVTMHNALEEAGVRVICNLAAIEPIIEDGRIKGVLADTKRGRKAMLAQYVVDATGDGDIAANAGLPFDFGREADGLVQGMTMMYGLADLDETRVRANPSAADDVVRQMRELHHRGQFPPFSEYAARSYLQSPRDRWVSYNMTPVTANPLDEEDLTKASIRARRQVLEYVRFWRQHMPGFENARIAHMAFALGVREGRRIRGRQTLTGADVVKARKRHDAIGHGFFCIDIHDPKGTGHSTWVEADRCPPMGDNYHIPLGMCLNDQIPNLAVVGRCASSTHEGHGSVRLQSHCMVMGQGLGTAIAMALSEGKAIADVDTPKLQDKLRADGVYLKDVPMAASGETPAQQ